MPKGKSPRRSELYRNVNEDQIKPGRTPGTTVRVSNDMRPGSPRNLRLRKKLHETVNKPDGFKEYKEFEKKTKKRSLGHDWEKNDYGK